MSQQINFYNAKLVKPKDWFSLGMVAIIYLLSAGLMLYFYTQLKEESLQKQQVRMQAQVAFDKAQKQLNEAMAASQNSNKQKEQEAQLKVLQSQLASQEKVIRAFEQVQTGGSAHVADYMAALSHQTLNNLWITGFKLEPFLTSVNLMGRATQSDLIPQYMSLLSLEPVFKGQLFGGINLKEVEQADERTQSTVQANSSPQASLTMPAQQPPVANPQALQKPIKLIEFEVKGMAVNAKDAVLVEDLKGNSHG